MRPICKQCLKASRLCRGFEIESGGFVFRNENDYASNKVTKRPRGGARKRDAEDILPQKRTCVPEFPCHLYNSSGTDIIRDDMSMTVLPLIPVPADLSCTLADHAFLALRLEYLHNPSCPDEGLWNFLGTNGFTWGPDRPDTCFNLAAMAVSLAAYGIKSSKPPALEQSRTKYTKALSETGNALCNDLVDPKDELLLTCSLLSAYEVGQIF